MEEGNTENPPKDYMKQVCPYLIPLLQQGFPAVVTCAHHPLESVL